VSMLSLVRRLPFFRILAIARLAMTARHHLQSLTPDERRRLVQLARHGRGLSPAERSELRTLVSRLEPGVFARAAVNAFSPIGIPGRLRRR
jgi:hypothetical protein